MSKRLKFENVIDKNMLNINSYEKANYSDSLNFFIKLNAATLEYVDFLKVIDFSIIILKNKKYLRKLLKKFNFKKYYLSELLSRNLLYVPKSVIETSIKISDKNIDLLEYYTRTSKNYESYLEILYLVLKNFDVAKNNFTKRSNNEKSSKELIDISDESNK